MMGLVPLNYFGENVWICFLLLICFQNFFSGGEYHGSIVFSLEHSKMQQNGLMSAISCLFAVFGLVAANGLATFSLLIQNETMVRGCFFIGGVGGLISYFLKNHCQESPIFSLIPQETLKTVDLLSFVKAKWQQIGGVTLALAFFIISYSFIFIFLPVVHFQQITSQSFDTFKTLIAYGLLLITAGYIADRLGMKKVMMYGRRLIFYCHPPCKLFFYQFINDTNDFNSFRLPRYRPNT